MVFTIFSTLEKKSTFCFVDDIVLMINLKIIECYFIIVIKKFVQNKYQAIFNIKTMKNVRNLDY